MMNLASIRGKEGQLQKERKKGRKTTTSTTFPSCDNFLVLHFPSNFTFLHSLLIHNLAENTKEGGQEFGQILLGKRKRKLIKIFPVFVQLSDKKPFFPLLPETLIDSQIHSTSLNIGRTEGEEEEKRGIGPRKELQKREQRKTVIVGKTPFFGDRPSIFTQAPKKLHTPPTFDLPSPLVVLVFPFEVSFPSFQHCPDSGVPRVFPIPRCFLHPDLS
ncbi:hypothetical protein CDL15_Pgr000391 [Punica granatum]|uniref:Uncharacterized protein n=1 Tax=Punica granatum TaxID=22663 RepID=A0A218XSR1_PUNGR|nr:hypothetical protein CDL15_Pgr000391 [Punica granatum]